MQTRNLLGALVLSLGTFALSPSIARADFGVGVKAGTLGAGIEGTFSLVSNVNLRLGANNFTYNFNDTLDNVDYKAEFDLSSSALMLDWHPFFGAFRVSAGVVRNRNELGLTATPTMSQTIGNMTYTPGQIGTLSGTINFKPSATYAGIGWGNAVGRNKRLGFSVDLGVLFQDAPQVTLSSSNGAVSQNDLRTEEAKIEKDIENFKAYPVIALGLTFRF